MDNYKTNIVRVTIFFLLLLPTTSFSQNEVSNWYIGKSGLDFNCNPPNPLFPNINFWTIEGCSTISDSLGNLLFYTDGCMVYDKTQQLMMNGDSIGEDYTCAGSSTQGALIVKQPLQDSIYYIFTTDCAENYLNNGFCFSIVNINLNNGKGEVILKKQKLLNKVCEKLAATRHSNGNDVWALTHEWGNNKFYAYKLTSTGLIMTPIISSVGRIQLPADTTINYPECAARGYMKFSPQGNKVVVLSVSDCHPFISYPELYNFDNTSGMLTFSYNLNTNDSTNYYGASFSPDGNLLYLSDGWYNQYGNYIHQFNLTSNDSITIVNSKYAVYYDTTFIIPNNTPGALQIGPDGKIYNACNSQSLNVIHNPNIYGVGCNFQVGAISLNDICSLPYSNYGLPNNDESIYLNTLSGVSSCIPISFADFSQKDSCANYPISFYDYSNLYPFAINNWFWDFGDPSSGPNNYSHLKNSQHIYLTPGFYQIKLIVYSDTLVYCKKDSIVKTIEIKCVIDGLNSTIFKENSVTLFPNPANNFLQIDSKETITEIKIFNIQNQLVLDKQDKYGIKKIDFKLGNGLYFILLYNGTKQFYRKIVIDNGS